MTIEEYQKAISKENVLNVKEEIRKNIVIESILIDNNATAILRAYDKVIKNYYLVVYYKFADSGYLYKIV